MMTTSGLNDHSVTPIPDIDLLGKAGHDQIDGVCDLTDSRLKPTDTRSGTSLGYRRGNGSINLPQVSQNIVGSG